MPSLAWPTQAQAPRKNQKNLPSSQRSACTLRSWRALAHSLRSIMSRPHHVLVHGIHPKVPATRLLGPGAWSRADARAPFEASLEPELAAALMVRLQGQEILGRRISVEVSPKLPRKAVRLALTDKARALRNTTPGFLQQAARFDEQGRYSLTPEHLAMSMAKKNDCTKVLDLGCGVGGNAIAFARRGAQVTAIERDPERAALARHNCRVYGVQDRVQVRCADALSLIPERFAGLVFCDPPWGRDWKEHPSTLERYPLGQALWEARARFDRLWLKLPVSFDPGSLTNIGASTLQIQIYFGVAEGDRNSPKFLVLRSRNRSE